MALIEREMVAAVGATAVALSPKARKLARKGAVYGLAGVLKAGDVVGSAARGAARGDRDGLAQDRAGADTPSAREKDATRKAADMHPAPSATAKTGPGG